MPGIARPLEMGWNSRHRERVDSEEARLDKAPDDLQALLYLGTLEVRNGNSAAAVPFFEKAARLKPSDARILNDLGYVYRLNGRLQEALKSFRASLRIKPHDPLTLCNIGLLQLDLNQPEMALKSFGKALSVEPDNVANLCNRGSILLSLGRPAEALADYAKAFVREPANPSVLNGLGDAHRDLNNIDAAVRDYQSALALRPDDVKTHANLAGVYVSRPNYNEQAIEQGRRSLRYLLADEFAADGPAFTRMSASGVSVFRLKHDLGQARYLRSQSHAVEAREAFIDTAQRLMERIELDRMDPAQGPGLVQAGAAELQAMLPYWRTPFVVPAPPLAHCLNPDNDWKSLEAQYLDGIPEILAIDNFLAPEALRALRIYCLASKVWVREYPNKYLGAFANQGFSSPLHFQLARELQGRMPRVFRDYPLNQLWAFKYDAVLGKGINLHADFALVNLNFWITPDEHNLDPASGGLELYATPAPQDWTFHDYNRNSQAMYEFLKQHNSASVTVPHRCNRAVLFNSALFHKTDKIHFADGYESRRINITYLFGRQLS